MKSQIRIIVAAASVAFLVGGTTACARKVVVSSEPPRQAAVVAAPGSASLKAAGSDLRNLASQQEIYYSNPANNYTYSTSLSRLKFEPSPGVTVTILEATQKGWSAIARAGTSGQACVFYVGEVSKVPTTSGGLKGRPGVVTCDN